MSELLTHYLCFNFYKYNFSARFPLLMTHEAYHYCAHYCATMSMGRTSEAPFPLELFILINTEMIKKMIIHYLGFFLMLQLYC